MLQKQLHLEGAFHLNTRVSLKDLETSTALIQWRNCLQDKQSHKGHATKPGFMDNWREESHYWEEGESHMNS